MNSYYAICPFCGKTIFVENAAESVCPVCGQALDYQALLNDNMLINVAAADEEYNLAQQYFMNNDFIAAGEHFKKVLTYNRNHYLADYYAILCDIYENEEKPDYNVPKHIITAVISSVEKIELCQANIQGRIDFFVAVLSQAQIILSTHFKRICEKYEKTEDWDNFRDSCLNFAASVKELANLDKEKLMAFDVNISRLLVSIADMAISACRKTTEAHLVSETALDLPTDYQFDRVKAIYGFLTYFVTSIDSNYDVAAYKPDYSANLLFNESVMKKLEAYNEENKNANKKLLSTPGKSLDIFRRDARIAIRYSHNTCFKSLCSPQTDKARTALINDSITLCFELLIPRIKIDDNKKVQIDVKKFSDAQTVGKYLGDFLNDFDDYNNKLTAEYANRFFTRLHEIIRIHCVPVYHSYSRQTDKLKESKNSEYRYYKDFLHKVIYSCALALKQIVPYDSHSLGERVKVLKLGKQATEEFLMLHDYKVGELEKSEEYSDVLDIFNHFDNNIAEYSKF